MINQKKSSKALRITLWLAQALLASSLIWGATMKLFQPIEKLSTMWPWAGAVPVALVKITGVVDLLGGIGLILPSLLRIKPQLTVAAAMGIVALMLCASVFHIVRGEISNIAPNIVFALLAFFIAWGRFRKAPIAAK